MTPVSVTQSREKNGIYTIVNAKNKTAMQPIKIHGVPMRGVTIDGDVVYGIGAADRREQIGTVNSELYELYYVDPTEVKFRLKK